MNIKDRIEGSVVVLSLNGKVMICDEAAMFRRVIKGHLAENRCNFVVDMSEVPWINSEGVGMLAMSVASIKNAGGRIAVSCCNEKVSRVLTITGCLTVIDSFDNSDDAIASFRE